jgi:ribosomal protein S18 acetylase RimI-like enzyme
MEAHECAEFITGSTAEYIEDRVTAGDSPAQAARTAADQMEVLFPGGRPAEGQLLFAVEDDLGSTVGTLWIGPHQPADPEYFWVWDIAIDPDHRGRGFGRATMQLAEEAARSHGATVLGLNVFGHNAVARRLYESLGYETTSVSMRKLL